MASGSRTPPELEERIYAEYLATQSYAEVSRLLSVPDSTVYEVVQRLGNEQELGEARNRHRAILAEAALAVVHKGVRRTGEMIDASEPTPPFAAMAAQNIARATAEMAKVHAGLTSEKENAAGAQAGAAVRIEVWGAAGPLLSVDVGAAAKAVATQHQDTDPESDSAPSGEIQIGVTGGKNGVK